MQTEDEYLNIRKSYVDKLDAENTRLHSINKDLVKALEGVKRGSCWCEMGIGNPMMTSHSRQCGVARSTLFRANEQNNPAIKSPQETSDG